MAQIPATFWALLLVVAAGFGAPGIGAFVSVPLGGLLAGMIARQSSALFKVIIGAAILGGLLLILVEGPSYGGDTAASVAYLLVAACAFTSLGHYASAPDRRTGELVGTLLVALLGAIVNVGMFFALFLELA